MSVALVSIISIDASAIERHASNPETVSRIFCMMASNPSSFFARSSTELVMWASNFVSLRGARVVVRGARDGKKIWG